LFFKSNCYCNLQLLKNRNWTSLITGINYLVFSSFLKKCIWDTCIHWKAKNNHFRFSLSLFTFFTLRLFPEKWFFHFFHFHYRFWKVKKSLFHFHFRFWKVKKSLFYFSRKVLKWKKWKAKVIIYSRSNVWVLVTQRFKIQLTIKVSFFIKMLR